MISKMIRRLVAAAGKRARAGHVTRDHYDALKREFELRAEIWRARARGDAEWEEPLDDMVARLVRERDEALALFEAEQERAEEHCRELVAIKGDAQRVRQPDDEPGCRGCKHAPDPARAFWRCAKKPALLSPGEYHTGPVWCPGKETE